MRVGSSKMPAESGETQTNVGSSKVPADGGEEAVRCQLGGERWWQRVPPGWGGGGSRVPADPTRWREEGDPKRPNNYRYRVRVCTRRSPSPFTLPVSYRVSHVVPLFSER